MKIIHRNVIRSFAWVLGVSLVMVVMVSVHELDQKVKMQMFADGSKTSQSVPKQGFTNNQSYAAETRHTSSTVEHNSTTVEHNSTTVEHNSTTVENKKIVKIKPVTHLGFLKVHKAASTTTQAIFLRFGWRRNLTFVLPPEYNIFEYPNIISVNESVTKYNTLPPPPGRNFEIICHHVFYGRKEWLSILPKDSVFVGTIREPFSHFVSSMDYFKPPPIEYVQAFHDPVDPVGTFLKNPKKYEYYDPRYSFINNRLALEYGVDHAIIENQDFAAFDQYLNEVLAKDFTVVILAEMFDESLVMLKRKLNWSLKDIMYAVKNVRSHLEKTHRYVTTDEHKVLHKSYAPFDYLLYDFFKAKLHRQIEEEDVSFQEEVNYFRDIRKYVENFCHVVSLRIKSIPVEKSPWSDGFVIDRNDCDMMHRDEISFTQMIRKSQYGSATWTDPRDKSPKSAAGDLASPGSDGNPPKGQVVEELEKPSSQAII